jgi:chloramphenicol-sensitive protein RarD
MPSAHRGGNRLSYLQALAAFVLWGIFPLYWKLLNHIDPLEIICHRIVWSFLTLLLCISWMRQWPDVRDALRNPKRLALAALAAVLISINWLVFIWGVLNHAVLDTSLGYFINPLVSVMLGVLFFREKLYPIQWVAVGIAGIGLVISASASTKLWVSIVLASSFAVYGVVKKKTQLPAVAGLGLETAILAPLAIVYLGWTLAAETYRYSGPTLSLLALGGPITTLPLLLFAAASKKVPLVVMGMLQYIGPTLQFLVGWWLDGEPVNTSRLLGFACVWLALVLFSLRAWVHWLRDSKRLSKFSECNG